ncbi:MAG: GNAT family N-acetyltransferase [Ktedonobacteraceae bacterium]
MEQKIEGLHIRDARAGEADAIRAVTLAAYEQYAKMMPPPLWEGYRANILEALNAERAAEHIVAEYMGEIVGSVLLYPAEADTYGANVDTSATGPEVRLLAVDPMARSHGIGKALMNECVKRARRAGATFLSLHTADIMQTAMQMYERMGFVRVPELDFYPGPNAVIKGYRLNLAEFTDKSE